MAQIPYGYKIVDGKAEIDDEQAKIVKKLFDSYISGLALKAAAQKAGLQMCHGSAGRMLRNKHYIGDEFYPAIIDKKLFEKAEEIRISRAVKLGRVRELKIVEKPTIATKFTMRFVKKNLKDPFAQAEYVYSLIESEVAQVE